MDKKVKAYLHFSKCIYCFLLELRDAVKFFPISLITIFIQAIANFNTS